VALNGEDNGKGKNDFDLYLIQGESEDIKQAVCSEDGSGQFGFCEVVNPAPGSWTAVVKRKKGEGLMQLAISGKPNPITKIIWSRYPAGYTCHFIRPDWKLPARAKELRRASP
jgi:hypothetical protein